MERKTLYADTDIYPIASDIEVEEQCTEAEAFEKANAILHNEWLHLWDKLESLLDDKQICIIYDLGLWDGRHEGWCVTDRLSKIIPSFDADITIYVEDDELMVEQVHHDGTNRLIVRLWQADENEYEFDGINAELLSQYTTPLGDYVLKALYD